MDTSVQRKLDIVAAIGLGLGGILGIAGSMIESAPIRQVVWAIDGTGIVIAAALLAIRYLRKGCDCVAAGFLVLAIGEGILLSGEAAGLAGSVPSFAAGITLWAAALFLTCVPREFAAWIRAFGILAALLFIATALQIFLGKELLPISKPLPTIGYPFFVITFAGWIWSILKDKSPGQPHAAE